MKRKCKRGAEQDVVYCRQIYCWTQRAGATSAWKRIIRRWERAEGKRETRKQW